MREFTGFNLVVSVKCGGFGLLRAFVKISFSQPTGLRREGRGAHYYYYYTYVHLSQPGTGNHVFFIFYFFFILIIIFLA